MMRSLKARSKVAALIVFVVWIGVTALYSLLKPISNGCIMTYMYPTYIPISSPVGVSSTKYGLYLYHEGWKKIDFKEHLKKLSGFPVLFIPGNGGSYKQVRSLAAESDRAYQGGPLEQSLYHEVSLSLDEGGADLNLSSFQLSNRYTRRLDWFAVDLEGEHSALDGEILKEHTEYVVHAIHRILDQYRESYDARVREGAAASRSFPKSVILVGHSMGGFVARAAVVHPRLRKLAVETVLTLSSPHQSPPLALQPSLGRYFAHINDEWRKGYEILPGWSSSVSGAFLSHVVVVSISGGFHDYQVRSKLEALDGIVPPTHGFMISSTAMKNVWLSMEHQAILWCNQMVVQVSHTLLSLMDTRTGQPFVDVPRRLATFSIMLRSGIGQSFKWMTRSDLSQQSAYVRRKDLKDASGSILQTTAACPKNVHWIDDGLERDLYIETTTVTVLAMDGRRRWLDLEKLVSNGKSHFIFVTNLLPCYGVRLHLWPEKGKSPSELPMNKRVLEVTSKMVQIPSIAAPRQIEPGSQTEQAPPTSIFLLRPQDSDGFRYLTISVAPRPTVSGRPPPAASMAVGQFFNPEEGRREFSSLSMLLSMYNAEVISLMEDHPLAFNLSFSISLGLFPFVMSLETTGCGIKNSGALDNEAKEAENTGKDCEVLYRTVEYVGLIKPKEGEHVYYQNLGLCKLRCFPPVVFAWDETSGVHIFPNMYSNLILVDSSPALRSSTKVSEKTDVLLLVDPHCSYKARIVVSLAAAAGRFLLLYNSQIAGFSVVIIFYALMRQAQAWNLDMPVPSLLVALESNLTMPLPFFQLAIAPIFLFFLLSILTSQPQLPPSFTSFTLVSVVCYLFANGLVITLILASQVAFYVVAAVHIFIKTRWEVCEENGHFLFRCCFVNLYSGFCSLKVIGVVSNNLSLVTTLLAISLSCFVHPALGLFLLLLSHAMSCHSALTSFLMTSFRSHARKEAVNDGSRQVKLKSDSKFSNSNNPVKDNSSSSPVSSKSFGETQLEIFHHCHGLLILHLVAALMFAPSFVAWMQRIGMNQNFPWMLDSALCTGVILHGYYHLKPESNCYLLFFPHFPFREVRLDFIYLVAGYYSYLSGLAMAPYRVFYAMAPIGVMSFVLRNLRKRNRENGVPHFQSRRHSHRN